MKDILPHFMCCMCQIYIMFFAANIIKQMAQLLRYVTKNCRPATWFVTLSYKIIWWGTIAVNIFFSRSWYFCTDRFCLAKASPMLICVLWLAHLLLQGFKKCVDVALWFIIQYFVYFAVQIIDILFNEKNSVNFW